MIVQGQGDPPGCGENHGVLRVEVDDALTLPPRRWSQASPRSAELRITDDEIPRHFELHGSPSAECDLCHPSRLDYDRYN